MNINDNYNPWAYDNAGDNGTGMINPPAFPGVDAKEMNTAIQTEIDKLINGAPEALDTLGELASAFENGGDVVKQIINVLGNKVDNKQLVEYVENKLVEYLTKVDAETEYQPKGNYLTEHQDLSDYAKSTDVTDEIAEAIKDKVSVSDFEEKLSEKQEKGDYVTNDELVSNLDKKVEWTDIHTNELPDRKSIILNNHDTILGETTTGTSVNIAMVSKWDKVDLGSASIEINLNGSSERPTYNDKKEIALKEDIPTKVSELENDSNYLTEHQSLDNYATKNDLDLRIKEVVGVAPEALDTLEEIAAKLNDDNDAINAINGVLDGKVDKDDVYTKDESDAKFLTEHQSLENLATKEEVDTKQDKGNYITYVDQDGRKVVTLENADIFGAKANEEELKDKYPTSGWISLIQLNKWNVVDLGSPKALTNINTPDGVRPTVQEKSQSGPDAHKIAYLDDIEKAITDVTNKFSTLLKGYKPIEGDDLVNVIKNGGDVIAVTDIKSSTDITLTKNTNLDLNGHSIDSVGSNYGDNVTIGNSANVIIKNGTINPSEKASSENQSATLMIGTKYPVNVTLDNVTVIGHPYPVYMNNTSGNANLTINSGHYYTDIPVTDINSESPAVYVGKDGNKVKINGGTFGKNGETCRYLLNINDSLTKKDGERIVDPRKYIEVTGGSFYNFDPSNCISEGEGTNFVADGYKVVSEQIGVDIIYKVIKEQ